MTTIRKMAEVGLLGTTAPADFGGCGADAISLAIAIEEIARADASCALVLSMANSLSILSLMRFGTADQRAQWLPGIVSGECLACFTRPSRKQDRIRLPCNRSPSAKGDRYILRGTKQFVSLGSVSRLAFVFVLTDPAAGSKGISCFLVPTDAKGFRVIRKEDKLGLRASDTCQIAFDDVEIELGQLLGNPGEGYRIALHGLGASRIGVAAQAVGVAAAALHEASAYARERASFGSRLIEHQAIAFRLADMATQIQSARLLTHHAASLKDRGEPYAIASSMAKLHSAEMCERVCSGRSRCLEGMAT